MNYLVNMVDGLYDDAVDIEKIQNEEWTYKHKHRKTKTRSWNL